MSLLSEILVEMNESASAGATSAGAIAGAPSVIGGSTGSHTNSHSSPLARYLGVPKKKRKLRKHRKTYKLQKVTEASEDQFDTVDVISKLKNSRRKTAIRNVVGFAMEDDDGNIIKVFIKASQAEDFEHALSAQLGDDNDASVDIAELLFSMKHKFDIVDVVWPVVPEDEEVEVDTDSEDDVEDMDDEDREVDDESPDPTELPVADEEAAMSTLSQVIDMMAKDADAKKAEAGAREAEAEADIAKYAAQTAEARTEQEEEILDMEAYNKAQNDVKKEAKRIAKLAKYKHSVKKDQEISEDVDVVSMEDLTQLLMSQLPKHK